ncbi:retrotransposon protein, putative, ty1-copia subclass [Tanacetum coccineum]
MNGAISGTLAEKKPSEGLYGSPFGEDSLQLRLVLSTEDKENYLEHPIPAAPVAQPGEQIPPQDLEAHELLQTVREFHTCKQEEGQSVSSHVLRAKGYIDNLGAILGHTSWSKFCSDSYLSLYSTRISTSFVQNFNMHGAWGCQQCGDKLGTGRQKELSVYLTELMKKIRSATSGSSTSDSSLLWHCRLGHISKKRIEKLQHDGLLNSIDIESLGKCVSCLSEGDKTPYENMAWAKAPKLVLLKSLGLVVRHLLSIEHQTWTNLDLELVKGLIALNHEEDLIKKLMNDLKSDINPIRRSTRTRRPTDRLCLYIDTEEHELGDLGEPANYRAALLDPESKKWLDAMNVEMQSMKDNDVTSLKARLVAKGFTQTYGVDYEETFSPVTEIRAIRILIAIAAYYDYEIWQMDVKTAHCSMEILLKEVYMEANCGFCKSKIS